MTRWIHRLHPGHVLLLWGLGLVLIVAFNAGRFEPALSVEEVTVLAAFDGAPPPPRNTDSLQSLLTARNAERAVLADEIARDSTALLTTLIIEAADASEREIAVADSEAEPMLPGRDSASATTRIIGIGNARSVLPTASRRGHFVLADPIVDSGWPWVRTVPSRVLQRAADGAAARVREELDTHVGARVAHETGTAKVQRSLAVKLGAVLYLVLTFVVTWRWFGRPRD